MIFLRAFDPCSSSFGQRKLPLFVSVESSRPLHLRQVCAVCRKTSLEEGRRFKTCPVCEGVSYCCESCAAQHNLKHQATRAQRNIAGWISTSHSYHYHRIQSLHWARVARLILQILRIFEFWGIHHGSASSFFKICWERLSFFSTCAQDGLPSIQSPPVGGQTFRPPVSDRICPTVASGVSERSSEPCARRSILWLTLGQSENRRRFRGKQFFQENWGGCLFFEHQTVKDGRS